MLMAGTDKIKERIREEARCAVVATMETARAEAARIVQEARDRADADKITYESKLVVEADSLRKRLTATAGLEKRKLKLQVRQELLEETFLKAQEMLLALPNEIFQELMGSMILTQACDEGIRISMTERDRSRLGDSFIAMLNDKNKETGHRGVFRWSDNVLSASGGFVLYRGEMEINGSLDILMGIWRPVLEKEAAEILFQGIDV
jgi:V/A-type H+-transporting ATPase subunit E